MKRQGVRDKVSYSPDIRKVAAAQSQLKGNEIK
jgi:hypothetical protein